MVSNPYQEIKRVLLEVDWTPRERYTIRLAQPKSELLNLPKTTLSNLEDVETCLRHYKRIVENEFKGAIISVRHTENYLKKHPDLN